MGCALRLHVECVGSGRSNTLAVDNSQRWVERHWPCATTRTIRGRTALTQRGIQADRWPRLTHTPPCKVARSNLLVGGFYALAAILFLVFCHKQFDSPSVVGRPSFFDILLSRSLLLLAPLLAPLLARLLLAHS